MIPPREEKKSSSIAEWTGVLWDLRKVRCQLNVNDWCRFFNQILAMEMKWLVICWHRNAIFYRWFNFSYFVLLIQLLSLFLPLCLCVCVCVRNAILWLEVSAACACGHWPLPQPVWKANHNISQWPHRCGFGCGILILTSNPINLDLTNIIQNFTIPPYCHRTNGSFYIYKRAHASILFPLFSISCKKFNRIPLSFGVLVYWFILYWIICLSILTIHNVINKKQHQYLLEREMQSGKRRYDLYSHFVLNFFSPSQSVSPSFCSNKLCTHAIGYSNSIDKLYSKWYFSILSILIAEWCCIKYYRITKRAPEIDFCRNIVFQISFFVSHSSNSCSHNDIYVLYLRRTLYQWIFMQIVNIRL